MNECTGSNEGVKNGDVVRLNSGGPPMTVQSVRKDGYAYCCWFVNDAIFGDSFPVEGLRKECGND